MDFPKEDHVAQFSCSTVKQGSQTQGWQQEPSAGSLKIPPVLQAAIERGVQCQPGAPQHSFHSVIETPSLLKPSAVQEAATVAIALPYCMNDALHTATNDACGANTNAQMSQNHVDYHAPAQQFTTSCTYTNNVGMPNLAIPHSPLQLRQNRQHINDFRYQLPPANPYAQPQHTQGSYASPLNEHMSLALRDEADRYLQAGITEQRGCVSTTMQYGCNETPIAVGSQSLLSAFAPVQTSGAAGLVEKFSGVSPPWLPKQIGAAPKSVEACRNAEVIDLATPSKHEYQQRPEPSCALKGIHEQPQALLPTQDRQIDNLLSNGSPDKNTVTQSRVIMSRKRKAITRGKVRRQQSNAIDVDNEENSSGGGVNRRVGPETVDLLEDAGEQGETKLKKRAKPQKGRVSFRKTSEREHISQYGSSKVMSLGECNANAATNPKFCDPLNQKHRPVGLPPRQWSPSSSPRRRSSRIANRSQHSASGTSPTKSADSIPCQESPLEQGVPIGGLSKEKRERLTDKNNFMKSTKRQRGISTKGADRVSKKSDGPGKTEQHSPIRERRRSRRTKLDDKDKDMKERCSTRVLKSGSVVEPWSDEDNEKKFSTAMLHRKKVVIRSNEKPKEHSGDSPQSNTVGEGSHSEDDDDEIGAGGNELSSDDDVPPSTPKRPTRMLRTQRRTPSKRGCKGAPHDSEDEEFMESGGKSANTAFQKRVKKGSSFSTRNKEASKVSSSPVNLVSPDSPPTRQKVTRRSPRNTEKGDFIAVKNELFISNESDDDFDESRTRVLGPSRVTRGSPGSGRAARSQRKRHLPSRNGRQAVSNTKEYIETAQTGSGHNDKDADVSSDDSLHGKDDDVGSFPSQEQGSQPIQLNVKVLKQRKKPNPKVVPEREFRKLTPDELAIIRVAFIKRYPAPPSNMQAQGRYEAAHGTEMTAGMVKRTWETQLKPWSDRWWKLYLDFNQVVREKKLAKPRDKDPTIREKEVRSWVDEYYRVHGDAKPAPQAEPIPHAESIPRIEPVPRAKPTTQGNPQNLSSTIRK